MTLELQQIPFSPELAFLLSVILATTALCGASLSLDRATPKFAPRYKHALLFTTLIFVFFSPAILWKFSDLGLTAIRLKPANASATSEAFMQQTDRSSPMANPIRADKAIDARESLDMEGLSESSLPDPIPPSRDWHTQPFSTLFWILIGFWGVGIFGGLTRLCVGLKRLRALVSNAHLVEDRRIVPIATRCAQKVGLRIAPEILESVVVASPLSIGCLKPRVILHTGHEHLSDSEMEALILHEYAHIARRDLLTGVFVRLTSIALWWNPLVHLIARRLSTVREMICDDIVAENVRSSEEYASILIEMASLVTDVRSLGIALGVTDGHASDFGKRIRRLLDTNRPIVTRFGPRAVVVEFLLSVLFLGIIFAASMRLHAAQDDSKNQQSVASSNEAATGDEGAAEAPEETVKTDQKKPHRQLFIPSLDKAKRTSWTNLALRASMDKHHEMLTAHIALDNGFPVRRKGAETNLFRVRLLDGSPEFLHLELSREEGDRHRRILNRDEKITWKIDGIEYAISYPSTYVAPDRPARTRTAMVLILGDLPQSKNAGDIETLPPSGEEVTDLSFDKADEIRQLAQLLLTEMSDQHGYRLSEKQSIQRVGEPFDAIRLDYYRAGYRGQYEAIPDGPSGMSFHWNEGRLKNWGMTFGSGSSGYSLTGVINVVAKMKSHMIEGDEELLNRHIPGDWIIREGTPTEQLIAELEKELRDAMQMSVRLQLKTVHRRVYVATGKFDFSPLPELKEGDPGTNSVHIFGKTFDLKGGGGGGSGTVDELLEWVGRWIDFPIINELESTGNARISWRQHRRSPFTEQQRKEDHDRQLVLEHISQQTGIRFIKDKRPITKLFVDLAD